MENNFQTQKIPSIYDKTIEEKIEEKDKELKRAEKKKKESKFKKFIKNHKALSFILGSILLFALTIGITYLALTLINMSKPKDVLLPELANLTAEEAKQKVEQSNLIFEVAGEEYNAQVEAGKVISQNPAYIYNYKIKEKSKVTVMISKGTEMTTVPKVIGMEKEEALAALTDAKLVVEEVPEKSTKVQEGYVIKQSIDSNTETAAGTVVQIYVSIGDGLEEILMPNLVGKTEEVAKQELTNQKLKLNTVVYEEDKTKPDGTVLKQDKEAGSTIKQETAVTLTVNKIAQIKSGTVQINLKSLTGYKEEKDEAGEVIEPEKVKLKVTSGNDVWCDQEYRKDLTDISVSVRGVGILEIIVTVDGTTKAKEQLDLNGTNPLLQIPKQ